MGGYLRAGRKSTALCGYALNVAAKFDLRSEQRSASFPIFLRFAFNTNWILFGEFIGGSERVCHGQQLTRNEPATTTVALCGRSADAHCSAILYMHCA